MYFNRFDICEAWYLWLAEHYQGQGSYEYRRLSRMIQKGFNPRPNLSVDTLEDNARNIYDNLCISGGCEHE